MLKNADEQTRRLAYAADHLIAVHRRPMSEAERQRELSDTRPRADYLGATEKPAGGSEVCWARLRTSSFGGLRGREVGTW